MSYLVSDVIIVKIDGELVELALNLSVFKSANYYCNYLKTRLIKSGDPNFQMIN